MNSTVPAIDIMLTSDEQDYAIERDKILASFKNTCATFPKFVDALKNDDIEDALKIIDLIRGVFDAKRCKQALILAIGFDRYIQKVVNFRNGAICRFDIVAINDFLTQASIILPANTTHIEQLSFKSCNVSAIYVPKSVKSLNISHVFDLDDKYLSIYFENDYFEPDIAFLDCDTSDIKCRIEFDKTLEDFERECM